MSTVRQYIGARYVTKIYENSLDPSSAEWEAGVTYEPLTLVTYNNSSYLSKKDVPGSVGDPASNPGYWVVTGAYNGQIATLQNQIDTINNTTIPALSNDINTINNTTIPALSDKIDALELSSHGSGLKGRKFILIGDSYGRGYDGDTLTYTYRGWTFINKDLLEAAGAEVYLLANSDSGGGFTTTPNWQDGLTDLVSTESWTTDDCESITDIVILGGTNDNAEIGSTYDSIKAAMSAFFTYAFNTFPNARIALGIVSANLTALCNNTAQTWKAYSECVDYGVEFLTDGALLFNNGTYIGNDLLHLTESGYEALSPKLFDLIVSGHCSYAYQYTVPITLESDFTTAITEAQPQLHIMYDQKNIMITLQGVSASGSGLIVRKSSSGVVDASFIKTLSTDVPAYVPFTRNYMLNGQGDAFVEDTGTHETKLNAKCSLFASSCAVVHKLPSAIGIQVGPAIFSRVGESLLLSLNSRPINVNIQKY